MSARTARPRRVRGGAVGCALALCACGEGDPTGRDRSDPAWLADEAAARGLEFTYVSGAVPGVYRLPEIMGGGAALLDVDADGDLDAYLVQGGDVTDPAAGPPNRLFLNDGRGRFEDRTEASGAGGRGYGMGVAAGDVDGDGRPDLVVTNVGPNELFLNRGGGAFEERGAAAGVDHPGWGTSAAFLDADVDGDLDLYVCNYVHWKPSQELRCDNRLGEPDYCTPTAYEAPAFDRLYRNDGRGRFDDVSRAAGIESATGTGLGVAVLDVEEDGLPDVFVANDAMPNLLWRNLGDGTFREDGLLSGCGVDATGVSKAGMGVAVGDVDDDGDTDLMVCNLVRESDSLYVNDGGLFSDRTVRAGLANDSRPFTRFGVGWVDLDHDGRLDLYQANGRVMRALPAHAEDPYAEPDLVLKGLGDARFAPVRGGIGGAIARTSRGVAFGDVDGDGALDVLVVHRDAPAALLVDRAPARGHWIAFRVGCGHGAGELHAAVRLERDGRTLRRDARSAYGYLSASDPAVHFGLGASAAPVDRVSVTWPGGAVETFGPFEVDRVHRLERGGGHR